MIFEKKVLREYKKQTFERCDDLGVAYYFSSDDFEGLKKHEYSFKAGQGHKLQGYFYWYDNPKENRLIIFEHGMGGGHCSYMREIEKIAKKGYMVFSYDHTGCMQSEGEGTNGFAQSLNDLDNCIKDLVNERKFKENEITVIGHSWGGFSALNIAAFYPDLKSIVAISGFSSVKRMIEQYFAGFMHRYSDKVYELEKNANPKYVKYDAVETLKESNIPTLIIHSADDQMVKRQHFDTMRNAVGDKKGIEFVLLDGKGHNPNYTEDAVKYKDAFFAQLTEKLKKNQLETPQQKANFVAEYDWVKMTNQDEKVWKVIFDFID